MTTQMLSSVRKSSTIFWLVTGADAAIPPPIACTERLMASHPMKKIVYVRGLMRLISSP